MKSILLSLLLLCTQAASASTGAMFFNRTIKGVSIAEVEDKAYELITKIFDFSDTSIQSELSWKGCSPLHRSFIEIRGLKVIRIYEYQEDVLIKKYMGSLDFLHTNCSAGN